MTVRRATSFDHSGIMQLLMEMYKNLQYDAPPMNYHKIAATIVDVTHTGSCFVAEEGGRIVGSIGGKPQAPWYSAVPVFGDYWFYVTPKARGRASIELLSMFTQDGEASNLSVQVGHVAGGDDVTLNLKDTFYERRGFKRVGSIFRR